MLLSLLLGNVYDDDDDDGDDDDDDDDELNSGVYCEHRVCTDFWTQNSRLFSGFSKTISRFKVIKYM